MKKTMSLLLICMMITAAACSQNTRDSQTDKNTTISEKSNSSVTPNYNRILELNNPPMEGPDVLELQTQLLSLGFNEVGEADGYYGPKTAGIVKKIKTLSGFYPDGKVDKDFWDCIFNSDNMFFLKMMSSVFTHKKAELIKTSNLAGIEGPDYWSYDDALYCYFSPIDLKPKIIEQSIFGGNTITSYTYYLASNVCYFIFDDLLIFYDPPEELYDPDYETEKKEAYFVNNGERFKVESGILTSSDKNADSLDSILKIVLDENGTFTRRQTESDFIISGRGVITAYVGFLPSVIIPAQINGEKVTAIKDNAFRNKGLVSVVIPDGIVSIGNEAFINNQLTDIVIPLGVTSIGNYTFCDNQLTSISIPDSVTSIGNSAFSGNQLTSITIPVNIKTIGWGAFAGNKLSSVSIGADVTIAQENAFGTSFVRFYNNNGKKAGTYVFNNGQWSMR